MNKLCLLFINLILFSVLNAQETDTLATTNKDAVYQRPFVLQGEKGMITAAVGGYLEGNSNYFVTDGVGDGFSMEMRRFNIFLYSTINERIRFLSELEFEHGVEEIALETALIDFEFNPALIFRAGILLVPIGYLNQNHDSPKWEFIDRPFVSTNLIPSTYSDIGFGLHGKLPLKNLTFSYETYLVNGLQDGIIANETNRSFLQAGKNEARFGEDNNGSPSLTGRIAITKRKLGEIGLSAFSGNYNTFEKDGLSIDEKRKVAILAVDYNFSFKKLQLVGEAAFINIEVAPELGPAFGNQQWGLHADLIYPIWEGTFFNWQNVKLNAAFRFEYADFNIGTFEETGRNIYDNVTAIVPGLSLRFSPNTLLRANFRYHWERDLAGNPVVKTAGFQFGFASYF